MLIVIGIIVVIVAIGILLDTLDWRDNSVEGMHNKQDNES